MQLVCVDPADDPLWRKLTERLPSDAFHSPEWIRVLQDTYGLRVQAFVVLGDSGEAEAGLSFCRVRDMLGDRIVTLPFCDYCDPLVADEAQWRRLGDALLADRSPVVVRCLKNHVPLGDPRFTVFKTAKWHVLDLQPELESIWAGLDEATRRAIRKAQRDGVVVEVAPDKESLRTFYEAHLGIRKHKYHLLAQPYAFFENIWRHFLSVNKGRLLVARCNGQMVAGVLYLAWKDTFYYKFNASVPAALCHRPNDLVIWQGIQYAKANGFKYLDFGLSDTDQPGLLRYKRQFGTREDTIRFLRCNPDGGPKPQEIQARELLGRLTILLTDESVPDQVTERAGEALYRFFA